MESVLIGYARVSTGHQNLDRQLAALTAAGCGHIYSEKLSGRTTRNRPQLCRAISRLKDGDVFVVAEWDRATRSMMDGFDLISKINASGASLRVLDRNALDLTTPTGRAVLGLLSAIYEEERVRIVERARQGIAHAKRTGRALGRRPKLMAVEAEEALGMLRQGKSYRAVATIFKVHHSTISNLKRSACIKHSASG